MTKCCWFFGLIFGVSISVTANAEKMYGVLMVVKGSVKISSPAKAISDGKVGARVAEGDTIQTGADSRAKVVMADRNVINVNPETQLVISKYENESSTGKRNVELNLLKGKVRNNVEQTYDGEKNKFLIKTPTAVAGVRGTQFLASFDPATQMTSIITFKGAVTLASLNLQGGVIGTPVVINKGETTQAAPNAVPEPPKMLPKEEMKKLDNESTASHASEKKRAVATDQESGKEASKPASAPPPPPPAMIDAKDMDAGLAKDIKDTRTPAVAPPAVNAAPPPMATPNPIVKEIIRENSGKTHLNVKPVQ